MTGRISLTVRGDISQLMARDSPLLCKAVLQPASNCLGQRPSQLRVTRSAGSLCAVNTSKKYVCRSLNFMWIPERCQDLSRAYFRHCQPEGDVLEHGIFEIPRNRSSQSVGVLINVFDVVDDDASLSLVFIENTKVFLRAVEP